MKNPLNFKFKNFDSDLKIALEEIDKQNAASGAAPKSREDFKAGLDDTLARYRKGVDAVFKAYMENDTLDPLIKHFTKDIDGGGGDEFFVPISERLVEKKDSDRVIAMWKTVMATRRKVGRDDVAKEAFLYLLDALSEIGDRENFDLIESDSKYLLTGKGTSKSSSAGQGKKAAQIGKTNNAKTKGAMKRGMSEDTFWELIEQAKSEAPSSGERFMTLGELLEECSEAESKEFQKIFGAKFALAFRWDLWGVAFMARGGCGDDEFEYFRAWLISEGKRTFESVLGDPESLADFITAETDPQSEELVGFADPSKHPAKPQGKQWSHEDLPKLFPRAWAKFHDDDDTNV